MPDTKQLAEPSPANEQITLKKRLKLEKFDEAQHEADLNLNKSFEDDSQDNDMQYSDSDQVADESNSNDMVSSRLKITLTGRNWHVIIKLQLVTCSECPSFLPVSLGHRFYFINLFLFYLFNSSSVVFLFNQLPGSGSYQLLGIQHEHAQYFVAKY